MDNRENEINRAIALWDLKLRNSVVQVICIVLSWYIMYQRYLRRAGYPDREFVHERNIARQRVLDGLRDEVRCRNLIRMGPGAFENLCEILQRDGGLRRTQHVTVQEKVAETLHILAHNVKNRTINYFFHRSQETISRYFHKVLNAIISLEDKFLRQPDGSEVPTEIRNSSRFYPYFKDCIGALDGTHVRVKVSSTDAPRYRGRKGYPTTNVLAACSFDLKFTYVLPGWEGTASDSRIIKKAFEREDSLRIPPGKYYLVDAGYMLRSNLIAPYRGVRYHLKEYSNRAPENPRELFNLRHSSLRNAIERAFGVLKKRFPIVGSTSEPTYSIDTQIDIILACCILHNYLMGADPNPEIIDEVDREILHQSRHEEDTSAPRADNADARQGELIRDYIAGTMWSDYVHRA